MDVSARRASEGGRITERLDNIVDVSKKKKKKPLTALRSDVELNNAFKLKAARGRLELRSLLHLSAFYKDFAVTGVGLCCRTGSVYCRIKHAELQDQTTGAERLQPFCPDMLFRECHFT